MYKKIENNIKLIIIFSSVYYIPYLLFGWIGKSGTIEASAPILYQILQLIIPFIIFGLYNIKHLKIKFSYKEFTILNILIFALFKYIIFRFDMLYFKSLSFFLFYVLIPKVDIKNLNLKKVINISFFITIITLLLEIFILPLFNIKSPFYIYGIFSRFIGNFGGPNILGLSGVCFFSYYYSNIKIDFIKLLFSILIVIFSASMSSFFTLIFMFLWINIIKIKNVKKILKVMFTISIILMLFIILFHYFSDYFLIFERYINFFSGTELSANSRLDFIEDIKNMSLIEHISGNLEKYKKVEISIFQIYINYGVIVTSIIIIILIKKVIFLLKRKNHPDYRILLNIIISIIFVSFINPMIFLFPYIFLFPLFLKIE